jgi:hypothetical protein
MKFFAYIISLYIIALTVLPTVRVVKKSFAEKCDISCTKDKSDEKSDDCEKGKIIMSLNFSPIQFVEEHNFSFEILKKSYQTIKILNSSYEKIFIDQFFNKIWQPPKIIFLI